MLHVRCFPSGGKTGSNSGSSLQWDCRYGKMQWILPGQRRLTLRMWNRYPGGGGVLPICGIRGCAILEVEF